MTESAISTPTPGLRARKREATRRAITARARTLTAERGLNGFTVEELCECVDISRRTFFNYFPSKEDALIGHLFDEFPTAAIKEFLTGPESGAERGPHGLTTTLLRDLFRLSCAMVDELNLSREEIKELMAAMHKEPTLMMKILGSAPIREKEFASLIAQREGLPPDDLMAATAGALFGLCSHRASLEFFAADNTRGYPELLLKHLRSAQQLFNYSDLHLEGTP